MLIAKVYTECETTNGIEVDRVKAAKCAQVVTEVLTKYCKENGPINGRMPEVMCGDVVTVSHAHENTIRCTSMLLCSAVLFYLVQLYNSYLLCMRA